MIDTLEIQYDKNDPIQKNYVNHELYTLLYRSAENHELLYISKCTDATTFRNQLKSTLEAWNLISDIFISILHESKKEFTETFERLREELEELQSEIKSISTGDGLESYHTWHLNMIAFSNARTKEECQLWIDWLVKHWLASKMDNIYIWNVSVLSYKSNFNELPDDFSMFTSLKKLDLNRGHFSKPPSYLPDSLEELYIYDQFDVLWNRIPVDISVHKWKGIKIVISDDEGKSILI